MNKTLALSLSITLIAILLIVFFISFLLYIRTPRPKGCETLGRDESKCSSCKHQECRFYKFIDEEGNK
ncbi:MAG: hypothetical protein IJ247_01345 [Bacilli bacterium]|nr:hypothetical protein [Bacilli bacterium]